jgi:hypothetical protein
MWITVLFREMELLRRPAVPWGNDTACDLVPRAALVLAHNLHRRDVDRGLVHKFAADTAMQQGASKYHSASSITPGKHSPRQLVEAAIDAATQAMFELTPDFARQVLAGNTFVHLLADYLQLISEALPNVSDPDIEAAMVMIIRRMDDVQSTAASLTEAVTSRSQETVALAVLHVIDQELVATRKMTLSMHAVEDHPGSLAAKYVDARTQMSPELVRLANRIRECVATLPS